MNNEQDSNRTLIEQTEATRFPPGVSGNPNGRPKNSVTTLLKNTDKVTTQKIASKLTKLAEEGDLKAIDMFIDRTDGRVIEKHSIVGKVIFEVVHIEKRRDYMEIGSDADDADEVE